MSDVNIDTRKTTAAPIPPLDKEIVVEPAPTIQKIRHGHRQRRFFLGPMPETIATASIHDSSSTQTSGLVTRLGLGLRKRLPVRRSFSSHESISRERAFTFFLSEGGHPEQFENQENKIKAEIQRRLRESRWFREEPEDTRASAPTSNTWIGETFEIGKDILGLPTLVEPEEEPDHRSRMGSPEPHAESVRSLTGTSKPASQRTKPSMKQPEFKAHLTEPIPETSTSIRGTNGDSPPSIGSTPAGAASSQVHLLASPEEVQGNKSLSNESLLGLQRINIPTPAATKPAALLSPPTALAKGKGKAKVTFSTDLGRKRTKSDLSVETPSEPEPAKPHEVLAREPELTTSAGAAARVQDELEPVDDSDILIRDRMLVRMLSTNGGISKYMDENQLLEMPEARKERATMWKEYLVVWKTSYIELYEPHAVLTKEWMTNQLHLTFKIPLLPTKTTVSIFSNVDMSFCVTCPKLNAHSHLPTHLFNRDDKQTTLIFIMKPKTRSRAVDWVWRLWRKLGGEIPDYMEIRCPVLDARVTFPIPPIDIVSGVEGYKTFTRTKVIDDCCEQMSGIPEWDLVIESALRTGVEQDKARLELCWRTESKLDWVWLDDDVNGMYRPWAVLFGIALKNPRFTSDLELRVAEHFPTKIILEHGIKLEEPPAVEGYLYRYKTESHVRDSVYLSTHNGNIFFLSTSSAHPPQPPTVALHAEADTAPQSPGEDPSPDKPRSLSWESEVRRGAAQMLNSKSFLDMRNVVSIQRAVEPWVAVNEAGFLGSGFRKRQTSTHSSDHRRSFATEAASTSEGCGHADADLIQEEQARPNIPIPGEETDLEEGIELRMSNEDAADEGGDEALDKLAGEERSRLKTRRSFEIVMRNKEVIRFEAYSCKVNLEWISKLRALISYWTLKQRVDARLEMDIVHAVSGRTRFLVSGAGQNATPSLPPNPREASDLLGRWWHWCVLDGCRSIIRAGRLYMRTKTRGPMKHYYFVLVPGHLIRFKLTSRSVSVLHTHSKTINLLDAYVTSGYFAALELDEGNKAFEPMARRFQDGLETDDADMDTLIIMRYRNLPVDHQLQRHARTSSDGTAFGAASHALTTTTAKSGNTTSRTSLSDGLSGRTSIPALNGQHNMLVLRARSKLERDTWCWALNAEIERLVRLHGVREQSIREDGRIHK